MTKLQKFITTMIFSIHVMLTGAYTYIMNTIDFHWGYQSAIVNHYFMESKFMKDHAGEMGAGGMGLVSLIIGLVIAFRVFVSVMPQVITDTKAVTDTGGTGAAWDTSEKAMWSIISLLMIVFGIFIAMSAMRKSG